MRYAKTFLALAAAGLLASCASSSKLQTRQVPEYVVTPAAQANQSKSDVTVEVEVLKPSAAYDHPELFAFDIEELPESHHTFATEKMFPEDDQGRSWCYTFGFGERFLTAMQVKVTNNTDHILRMGDSRIYLVPEGESPIAAVTELGNARLVGVTQGDDTTYLPKSFVEQDESLTTVLTTFEREWDKNRDKGLISLSYPLGFASLVVDQNRAQYKLINDLSVEILPNFSEEGILLFPTLVSWPEARLMFYDITTKTDAAGNPVEKTSFEFPLALEDVDMWYDKEEKRWKKGLPPAAATASTAESSEGGGRGGRRGPR